MGIKLVNEKPYNRLDRNYSKCFNDLGFYEMHSFDYGIPTTSLSILVNGIPWDHFKLERVIRQGV